MKKIVMISNNLFLGGITSYLITLSKYLCDYGYDITLLYHKADEKCLALFCPKIHLVQMPELNKFIVVSKIIFSRYCMRFISACLQKDRLRMTQIYSYTKAKLGKRITEIYDLAISSEEFYCNAFVASGRISAKKRIGWIHPDYKSIHPVKDIDYRVFSQLDKVVVVSESNKKILQEEFPEMRMKFEYIENLLDESKIISASKEKVTDWNNEFNGLNIITVCRLDNSSKRVDRIVNCCEYFKKQGLNFTWHIIGDGKDRGIIEQLICEKEVQQEIVLHGKKENPYPYIAKADVFILTSQYEGKPISVEEAKILKCPVIVTDYKSASEQVPKEFGAIINNKDETIAKEIYELLCTEGLQIWKQNLADYKFDREDALIAIKQLVD